MAEHNLIGEKGEELATEFLVKKGYEVLTRNWRFQRAELDIVAQTKSELIVVEVKTRTSEEFESPKEAVTISKQKK